MAYDVSSNFRALSQQINKELMIILKIEGSQYLYGSAPITEQARWDDPRITWDNDEGITWDGEIERDDSRPYIITKGQTGKQISQQLLVDKGGSGSVSVFPIELVDYKGEVAKDLSFNQIGDPLGAKAEVLLGFRGGLYPADFIHIIKGYVDDIIYNAGSITVSVALATNLVRQSSYEGYVSALSASIDAVQTNIPVNTSNPFIESQDALTSYIQIDEEIMEVVSKTDTEFTVIRSRLNTLPATHDFDAEVSSIYRLQGHPIDLALKLLHSKQGNQFSSPGYTITALNRISSTEVIENTIIVDDIDIQATLGLVPGDLINLVGTASNDGIKTALEFGVTDTGTSYITVEETLTEETGLSLDLEIKSKWNLLPDGAGLDIDFIDTEEFEAVKDTFSAAFIDYDFIIRDTIDNTRDFIINELMKPSGAYLIPRKAKTSIKFTSPPFSADPIPVLNTSNLYDLTKLQSRRSTHKYLLNSIIFRYNEGILEDKFFDKIITLNADSFSRIPVGRRRQEVNAKGIKRSSEAEQIITQLSNRILNRYRFGARYVKGVKVLLEVGISLEIGDIVFFGGPDTQLVNLETGERDLPAAQYEIINKKLDATRGTVELELLETGFGIDGIFGTYSPSSFVGSGSSTDRILLSEIWDSSQYEKERDKWDRWIGLKIRVRSEDYTFDEVTTLDDYDPATLNGILLDPPLSAAPVEGYIVELAKYEEYGDTDPENILKLTHVFPMPSALITAVTDDKTFEVDPSEVAKFTIGMEIQVHSEDYTKDTETRIIDDIISNQIILNENLNISPAIDDRIEVYAYADAKGYRIL